MEDDSYKTQILEMLHSLKHKVALPQAPGEIPVLMGGGKAGMLSLLGEDDVASDEIISLLAKWREMHNKWFPAQFKVTFVGTRKWLQSGVINNPDRLLFMLSDAQGKMVGHMGFYRFDFANRTCEVDNIVRGEESAPGLMTAALEAMMLWGIKAFQLSYYTLSTYAENERAISLYKRLGFKETGKFPLVRKETDGRVDWVDAKPSQSAQRYSLKMKWVPKGAGV